MERIVNMNENNKENLNNPLCHVGDKLYIVLLKFAQYVIKECEVYEIVWNQNGMFYQVYPSVPNITQDKFGKTVFLNEKEAEQKAQELTEKAAEADLGKETAEIER